MTSTNALIGVSTTRAAAVEVPACQALAFEHELKARNLPVNRQKGIFYALLRLICGARIYYIEGPESSIKQFEELAVSFGGAGSNEKEED